MNIWEYLEGPRYYEFEEYVSNTKKCSHQRGWDYGSLWGFKRQFLIRRWTRKEDGLVSVDGESIIKKDCIVFDGYGMVLDYKAWKFVYRKIVNEQRYKRRPGIWGQENHETISRSIKICVRKW